MKTLTLSRWQVAAITGGIGFVLSVGSSALVRGEPELGKSAAVGGLSATLGAIFPEYALLPWAKVQLPA